MKEQDRRNEVRYTSQRRTKLLGGTIYALNNDKLGLGSIHLEKKHAIICPASYNYYSTNHNDGVEDYFNQTDNGEF